MKPHFEVKYLDLIWYDKNTLTKVTESISGLQIQYDDAKSQFECETTIYPNAKGVDRGQLAIRFLNNKIAKPYIDMPNGNVKYLTPIKDVDTGRTWWIVADEWDQKSKVWRSIAPNIVGSIKFSLQGKPCILAIAGADFTLEQLESYLSSFKNDLWELILDESSAVQANAKTSNAIGVNDKIIECINNLVSHAEKVLITPKAELREVQALKPRKAVKPVNRTFMELASKTNQRFLTSRATDSTFNVAENRYVLFALERCYRIVKQVTILANNKAERYKDTVTKLENQHNNFSDSVLVERELVVNDLKKLAEQCHIDYWQKLFTNKLDNSGIQFSEHGQFEEFFIRIESLTKDGDGFFIKVWDGSVWGDVDGKYSIISFRHNESYAPLLSVLQHGMILQIICQNHLYSTERLNIFNLNSIKSIKLIGSESMLNARLAFNKEKLLGKKLSEQSWQKKLTGSEIEEQEKEKASLRNRIGFYEQNQTMSEYVYEKVAPKLRQLDKLIKAFKKLQVKPSSHFPNSMTFVQNPHYQGVHNGYKTLCDVTNLADEELLLSLEEIDAIGLVNMPILYERWCLLQIIKILKESFRFTPQDNWKYLLIEAVKTNKTDIELLLTNQDAKRFIKLTYEKTLDHGKRPDFVLDLIWFTEKDINNTKANHKRFVMDAKFYNRGTFERFGGLINVIKHLYYDKNYSENDQNPVFLIHPCFNALPARVTSQSWGKYSYLGEVNINIEESEELYPNHCYGGILLNPIDRELYNDELQRLIGLFLQYKLEDSNTRLNTNDKTVAVPICIRCGSAHVEIIDKTNAYKNSQGEWVERTPRSVWTKCMECEQYQIFNHCRTTDTRLIKNGLYWSYHSARAIEPFNMKSPKCGEWGAW